MAPCVSLLLPSVLLILIIISSGIKISDCARKFTIINECKETIWPGFNPNPDALGFELKSGHTKDVTIPVRWHGDVWGRTGCTFDASGEYGPCEAGACGMDLKCKIHGTSPMTSAHFNLRSTVDKYNPLLPDTYGVGLVDGFNVPITIEALKGNGNCTRVGCTHDLMPDCPANYVVKSKETGKVVGCNSACAVANTAEACCTDIHEEEPSCKPINYAHLVKFKEVCPSTFRNRLDSPSSFMTCYDAEYIITFCPSSDSKVCTYHGDKIVCSGLNGLKSSIGIWVSAMLTFFLVIYFLVTY